MGRERCRSRSGRLVGPHASCLSSQVSDPFATLRHRVSIVKEWNAVETPTLATRQVEDLFVALNVRRTLTRSRPQARTAAAAATTDGQNERSTRPGTRDELLHRRGVIGSTEPELVEMEVTMPTLDTNVLHHPVIITQFQKRAADVQLRIADQITAFAGSMNFVYLHVVLFATWMLAFEKSPWPTLT